MGLLILSFAVFGLQSDIFGNMRNDSVITAKGRSVSTAEFASIMDRVKENITQQSGKAVSFDEIVEAGQHTKILDELSNQIALGAFLDQAKILPSPKLVVAEIAKIPAFFNQTTGAFDKDKYKNLLAEKKYSQKVFEQEISDTIARNHYGSAAYAGMRLPRFYTALEAADRQQARDASVFVISPANIPAVAPATEAEAKTFYDNNADRFTDPEWRQIKIVRFVPEEFLGAVTIDEDALKKMYDFSKDSLSTPETRTFVTITATDMNAAEKMAAALRSGQSPDAVAKSFKAKATPYDRKPKTAVPDAALADGVFAMKAGEIKPIKGSLGIAVVAMTEMYPGTTPTFEQVRPKLVEEYRLSKAKSKMTEVSEAWQDGVEKGEKFDALAARLGMKVYDLPPFAADGSTPNPQLNMQQYPDILRVAYSTAEGASSDVESQGQGQFFALTVVKIKPAGKVPFDTVKGQLVSMLTQRKAAEAVKAKAEAAQGRINAGEPIEKVAADMGLKVQSLSHVDRINGPKQLPPVMVGYVFDTPVGKAFSVSPDNMQYMVGKTTAIHTGTADTANVYATMMSQGMSQRVASDIFEEATTSARTSTKLKTYPKTAAGALGVKVADEPKGGKKDEAKKDAPKP